jgi:hypothetical protein
VLGRPVRDGEHLRDIALLREYESRRETIEIRHGCDLLEEGLAFASDTSYTVLLRVSLAAS